MNNAAHLGQPVQPARSEREGPSMRPTGPRRGEAADCASGVGRILVRQLIGAELDRRCLLGPDGDYLWLDAARTPACAALVTAAMATAAERARLVQAARMSLAVRLPRQVAPGTVAYDHLPTSGLLVDGVLAAISGAAGTPAAAHVLALVGASLAALHSCATPARRGTHRGADVAVQTMDAAALLRQTPPADPPWATGLRLILDRRPRLTEHATRAATLRTDTSTLVPVHGNASMAAVASSNDLTTAAGAAAPPVLLGWLRSGWGHAAHDLGYLLGELLELAADHGPTGDLRAVELGRAGLRGYLAHGGTRLPVRQLVDFVALRVVDHIVKNVRSYGLDPVGVARLLDHAENVIPLWGAALHEEANDG
ncbi:hypothetical protein [Streptomyces sp. NPDC088789]|uniref:hypothetical protein n=1 Tax=Streptomyces sp. NPDC088789 TaxID=3365899 RepID=UPI003803B306